MLSILNKFKKRTIFGDLTISLTIVIVIVVLIIGIINYIYNAKSYQIKLENKAQALTIRLSEILAYPLWILDNSLIENHAKIYLESENIDYIKIVDENNKIIYQAFKQYNPENLIIKNKPISYEGEKIGLVEIGINKSVIKETKKNIVILTLTIMLLVIFSIVITNNILLVKFLDDPISNLIQGIERISAGNYDKPLPESNHHDLNSIIITINKMMKEISEREKSINNYAENLKKVNIKLNKEIEEKIKAENALKKAEEKWRSIFENATEGIFQSTVDGKILIANTAMARIFGYDSKEEFIQSITNIQNQLYVNPMKRLEFIQKISIDGKVNNFEFEAYKKDGSIIYISANTHVVKDSTGKILYYEGILDDITEKKKSEELRIAKDAADAANKAKSEFLANMSHEIRTPMNAILGFTDLLEQYVTDPIGKKYINTIKTSGNVLLNLINDILDLSKIEAGKMSINYNKVNIYTVFNEIKNVFEQKIQNKGLDFILDVSLSVPNYILFDEIRLRQILFNLVGNAVKFTDNGYVKLIADMDLLDNKLIITVEDTGVGIPDNEQNSIFEAFVQKKDQDTKKYGGTGLGLSITKKLTEMLDGKIYVESKVNVGSKFILEFSNIEIAPDEENVKGKAKDDAFLLNDIKFNSNVVLIADDIKSNRDFLKGVFNYQNIITIEAENGEEAIEMARKYYPNLILMDVKMPIMNGYEATKVIKSDPKTKNIPIIILTASSFDNSKIIKDDIPFDKYFLKPISKEKLLKESLEFLSYEIEKKSSEEIINKESYEEVAYTTENNNIKEFFDLHYQELFNEWEKIKDSFIFDEIEIFTKKIIDISDNFKINLLKDWAEKLLEDVKSYDMVNLPKSLNLFPEIIKKIQV